MNKQITTELFATPWAMEPAALAYFRETIERIPEASVVLGIQMPERKSRLIIDRNVATIPIEGVLMKTVPDWFAWWGLTATGYDEILEMLGLAMANRKVTEIRLAVSSGGGQVAGLAPVAEAIAEARKTKKVTAVIEDIAASAAYWLASQAETITAVDSNTTAGSIGVYTVYYDFTGAFEKFGVKSIVIRSGEHKGMGEDQITDEQIKGVKEMIDAVADNFIDAVASGRRADREKISGLATGQLWIAGQAKEMGLIDEVVGDQVSLENEESETGVQIMKDQEQIAAVEPQAAGDEISVTAEVTAMREAFPEDPEFAMKALAAGWSVEKAKAEYNEVLRAKIADLETEKAAADAGDDEVVGGDPLKLVAAGGDRGSDDHDFMEQARQMARDQGISVTLAMRELAHRKPELHQAYLVHQKQFGKRQYVGVKD
jgi:signal peptide peptidase SppA